MEVRLLDHYSVREDDEPFQVDGLLEYEFPPTDAIIFSFQDREQGRRSFRYVFEESEPFVWQASVNVLGLGVEILADIDEESGVGYVRTPLLVRPPAARIHSPDEQCVQYLLFHLVNLPQIDGYPIRIQAGRIRRGPITRDGRNVFAADGWQVTVDAEISKPRIQEFLRRAGGFAVTHVGKLERTDGASFSFHDGLEFLDELVHFFAFVGRKWSDPILPIAYNANDEPIIEEWQTGYFVDEWQRHSVGVSWSRAASPQDLTAIFREYWNLLSVQAWHENIELAIRWYLQSFAPSTNEETAIVLGTAGLELLATLVLRELRIKRASKTASRLRQFLKLIDVDLAIPKTMDSLLSIAGIDDGPAVVVEFRNGLVHGDRRERLSAAPHQAMLDAASLTQWYLELALLRLFNHVGSYWNSIENKADAVPWSSNVADWRVLGRSP